MRNRLYLLLFNLLLLTNAGSQVGSLKDVDQYLNNYLDRIPVPGFSIVIVEDKDVLFAKGYGVETYGKQKRMTPQSTVAIGSLGRGFTAMAIMQLVEKGSIDLDEPIITYLPWFQTANKNFSDQITLRMCLSNTTGIPPQFESLPNLDDSSSSELFLRSLEGSFIKRKPGQSHEFSDEGYVLAGQIIQEVTGQPYSDYIATQVLQPLGMTRSTASQPVANTMDIVYGHEMGLDHCHPAIKGVTDANYVAAGSEFYASAADLGKYMIALLNGGRYKGRQVVQSESVEEIFKPNTSFQGLGTMLGGNGIDIQYALGWMEMTIEEREILIHTGNNGNVASIMGINRAKNQAFVLLFNADVNRLDRFKYPGMEHAVNNVIHILNAEDTTDFGLLRRGLPNDNDYNLPKEKWDKYIGKYASFGKPSPFFKDMNIEVYDNENGDLELITKRETEFKGQYKLEFTNESRAILRNISLARQIQFSINPEGEVSGLFMFGSEFKKENEALAKRFTKTMDPSKSLSFLLPATATQTWTGDALTVSFKESSEMIMQLSAQPIKTTEFGDFVAKQLAGKTIKQRGILNKELLKKGIWIEQSVITQDAGAARQYHFAFYQDPVSGQQVQVELSNPWGADSVQLQEVMAALHRSVSFE